MLKVRLVYYTKAMETISGSKSKMAHSEAAKSRFYHGTLVQLDGQPLFARGTLPTIHTSLTYTVWYMYWMSRLDRTVKTPGFFVYRLIEAERYLIAQGEGLFSVSEIGIIPYDDRNQGLLLDAPELFKKGWDWGGKLTYIPARCLERVSASTIRQEVQLEEWLRLCHDMDADHPFRGIVPSLSDPTLAIPDFLKKKP